jgi:DNA-binding NtrC family response regulator
MDLFTKLRSMQLLLIDDDQWIRNSLGLFFQSEGCEIIALETAEEGLPYVEKQKFDVIIVDYRLPGMDGIEFIERLPANQSNTLNILISAYGSKHLLSKAKKIGIHQFIPKPFTTDIIEDTLNRLITG